MSSFRQIIIIDQLSTIFYDIMILRSFLISMLLFLTLLPGIANERSFILRHYQVKDGLSDNLITCFMQDKQGYLWIGTRDGLNRFDGYNFRVYRNEDIDIESQRYNRINYITLDREGNLWISMRIGLYKYDVESDSFHLISSTKNRNIRTPDLGQIRLSRF
jgi:ligand-binding sensor domain-containing protein